MALVASTGHHSTGTPAMVTVLPRLVMNCWCSTTGSPVAASRSGWPSGPASGTCSSVNSSCRERNSQVGTPRRLEVTPLRSATNRLRSTWRRTSARRRTRPA
ncbi:MAG: hypothetical protein ACKO3G_01265 [Planctomycetaceae bacterium]